MTVSVSSTNTGSGTRASSKGVEVTALFQGYDTVLGEGRANAAVTGTESGPSNARATVACSVCTSESDVYTALDVDESMSVGMGGLDHASEKVSYIKNMDISTYSVTLVVRATRETGTYTCKPGTLALASGVSAPTDTTLKAFVQDYGDSYVSSITKGGEYYGIYTFYSQTKTEQQTLIASMKAKGVTGGMTVTGSVQSSLSSFIEETDVSYKFSQTVVGVSSTTLPEPDGFIEYALAFSSLALDKPTVISIGTTGYEAVSAIGSTTFSTIKKNREYFIGDSDTDGLIGDLVTITGKLKKMDEVNDVYSFYGYTASVLSSRIDTAEGDISDIGNQFDSWEDDPTQTFTAPSLLSLTYGTPVLKYVTATSSACGGGGGGSFNDVSDPATYIQRMTRISAMQMRAGERVDALYTTYEYQSGDGSYITSTCSRGGSGGGASAVLTLERGQFVTAVNAVSVKKSGSVRVRNLKVTTDAGTLSCGGGGTETLNFSVPTNSAVLGFTGRSGKELDQIQVVYATFADATWVDED